MQPAFLNIPIIEILDHNSNDKIKPRSPLLNIVEWLLLAIYTFLILDFCYARLFNSSNVNLLIFSFICLLIFSNLKFVYSSRKAIIAYEENQNNEAINKLKKSISRISFICTEILLFLLVIILITKFITEKSFASIFFSLDKYIVFSAIVVGISLPVLQLYYIIKTTKIFRSTSDN